MSVALRRGGPDDAAAVAALFHRAVQEGAARHYSQPQRDAWSGPAPDLAVWRARLEDLVVFLAEDEDDGALVGFMTLAPQDGAEGLLDHAFVAPEHQGSGVAGRLLDALTDHARAIGITRLTVAASHQARAFLRRHGWRCLKRQEVTRKGVALVNFAMDRQL